MSELEKNGAIMIKNAFAGWGRKISRFAAVLSCILLLPLAPAAAETHIPSDSRLKTIIAKKAIRIAYRADARPFSFVNDAGEPLGYTIDLCKQVTNSIAHQFGLEQLKIEWVPVTVETRFAAVASGKADLECGSSTVTLGRMKDVDFSIFVFVESTGILVSRASNIHSFAEMVGKKIAIVTGTTNARAVTKIVGEQNLNIGLVEVKDRDEGIALLETRQVDGFASDKLLLAGAQVKNSEGFVMLPDDLSIEQYGIVVPRGDWALRLAVNTGLAQIFRSRRVVSLFERWFFGAQPGLLLDAVYTLGRIAD
jgi:glutamate/aspartate transport system substrate-binding protein